MCFSATASFTASAVLGFVGTAALVKTKNKKAWPLMAIPLLFAIQQFIEGLLWLSIHTQPNLTFLLTHIFLFFALFFWPVYIPLAVLALETNKIRRILIFIFCIGGAAVGIIFYADFLRNPEAAQVINRCLFYPNPAPYPSLIGFLYILATIGPGAISSKPLVKILSVLVLISSLITWYFYAVNFISVWCFFAAIISGVLYFYPEKK
jgi:hypothetical protein